ncbi:anion transporter [Thermanaerosceptrum fracticalcis]|uniref:Anion transporter n=1 Tax=Thermanaerosceptrum fracticalcis TaxID=1712410 RepID=A0A7G6E7V6_THEFR|nr:SLC13 family permease [Thermanaerosceptrum fracticalcis]QNB48160.1 anion transporter [Thermanaerosceptrum fracticalcis]
MRQYLQAIWTKEPLFVTASFLVAASSFFVKPSVAAIDWKVIIILFNLMAVIIALEKYRVLDELSLKLLERFRSLRLLSICLVLMTGFFAMFITNDVALLTLVPLSLLIAKRCSFNPAWLVILQTLAANIGSSLTPMGNPQNLFLYEYYKISPTSFINMMAPFVIGGLISLIILAFKIPPEPVQYKCDVSFTPSESKRQLMYLIFFGLVVLSVLRAIDYRFIFFFTLLVLIIFDRELLLKIDYYLLGTFIAFFLLVDNLARLPGLMESITVFLNGEGNTFLLGAILSQFISNVPAAILLANFTGHYRELLWGVNVGGMGTLIASLASLISYKLYAKEYPGKDYLVKFHIVNLGGLLFFTGLVWIYLIKL